MVRGSLLLLSHEEKPTTSWAEALYSSFLITVLGQLVQLRPRRDQQELSCKEGGGKHQEKFSN